jgi:hypothetical protein
MFEEIVKKLKECSSARYEVAEDRIRVLQGTAEGFEVMIEQIWENHFTVTFDGWHEEFFDLEKAEACFLMGLSNRCRLKIQEKGGSRFQWTLECLDGEEWKVMSSTQRFIHQFWKPPVTTYLQNDLISSRSLERFAEAGRSLAHTS